MKNNLLLFTILFLISCKKKDDLTTYIKFDFDGNSYYYSNTKHIKNPTVGLYSNYYLGISTSNINTDSVLIQLGIARHIINGKKYQSAGYSDTSGQWVSGNFSNAPLIFDRVRKSDGNYYFEGTFSGNLYRIKNADTITGAPIAITSGRYMIKDEQ